jgi:hypothetical protein
MSLCLHQTFDIFVAVLYKIKHQTTPKTPENTSINNTTIFTPFLTTPCRVMLPTYLPTGTTSADISRTADALIALGPPYLSRAQFCGQAGGCTLLSGEKKNRTNPKGIRTLDLTFPVPLCT